MKITPIGVIHTPHKQATGTPVQPAFAQGIEGTVELLPEFAPGLKDLDGFERVWLIYWFDRASEARLEVTPFLDAQLRGLFATRSPCRPNPIGISCVRISRIEGNVIHILDADMLDGTPLEQFKLFYSRALRSAQALARPFKLGQYCKIQPLRLKNRATACGARKSSATS